MTVGEAAIWAASSTYHAPLFHATTVQAATLVRLHGFDPSARGVGFAGFGRFWGNGVYATPDVTVAAHYATLAGSATEILTLRINVRRLLSVRLSIGNPVLALEQMLAAVPNGQGRYLTIARAIQARRPDIDIRTAALTHRLEDVGYV